ncbi:MAG: class I tRNA ligase family protein, partial [Planctomycetia bacterium]
SKPRLRPPAEGDHAAAATRVAVQRTSAFVLDQTLRLLHPVMPFVTEEVWAALGEVAPQRGLPTPSPAEEAAIVAAWPKPLDLTGWAGPSATAVGGQVQRLQELIRAVRAVRASYDIKGEVDVLVDCDAAAAAFLTENSTTLATLAKVKSLVAKPGVEPPPQSAVQLLADCRLYVPLAGVVDVAAERAKQEAKREDLKKRLAAMDGKLSNEGFVRNAKPEVIEQHRASRTEAAEQLVAVEAILADLGRG